MKTFALSCISALAAAAGETGDINFTSIGQFKQKEAAFIQVTKFDDSEEFMLVTAFSGSPISNGSVTVIPGLKEAVVNGDVSNLKGTKLDSGKTKF